jgi:alanine-alpha-ketoisovalerate/valine-pyruvate aminotransferase
MTESNKHYTSDFIKQRRLSKKRVNELENMCRDIYNYVKTPEGQMVGEQVASFLEQHNDYYKHETEELTDKEKSALTYIEYELSKGKRPTVRGVAEAVGLRSSRMGQKVVDGLVGKGVVCRDCRGRLETVRCCTD